MTISVVPKPRATCQEGGLSRDLTLVGTPSEFDLQFLDAIREYRCARSTLAEQAKTTVRVLEAATQVSATKANSKGRAKREAPRQELAKSVGQGKTGDAAADADDTFAFQPDAGDVAEPCLQADLFE